jgi:tetratricopeptide (TPR) repeat protein
MDSSSARSLTALRLGFVMCVLSVAAGCATSRPPTPITPEQIHELEERQQRDAADVQARIELGAAYVGNERPNDALALLEPLASDAQAPASAAFYLGLAYEQLDRTADARRQYTAYLERGSTPALVRRVRSRLALLDRRDLELAVEAAVASEQTLAGRTPPPRSVGVFPFITGLGEELRPLGRAFAELLSSDLGQTDRVTVVERARVQYLLDEIRLAETGAADPQTAARAGRMLGAGRIVQGRLDGDAAALRIQALVVPVPGTPPAPVTQTGALNELFALQTNLAYDIFAALGVELTAAERERIAQRPTQNVQALLAFGFGIEAEDVRRYPEAIVHYERAVRLDPSFAEAQQALDRARIIAEADETPDRLATAALLELDLDINSHIRLRRRLARIERLVPSPEDRDPIVEVLGLEGIGRRSRVDVVVPRPTGGK